jgi:mechanosensitive ion channel-like protein
MVVALDFGRGVEDAWASVADFVPRFFAFLLILVIGYFIAKALAKVLDRVLERAGFDRAVERGGIKRILDRTEYDASDIVSTIVFWAVFLIVLQMAFGTFGPNPVSDLIAGIIAYLPKVFAAILIVVVLAAVAAFVKGLLQDVLGDLGYGRAVANAVAIAIIVFAVFAALNQLQIAPAIVNATFYAVLAIIAGSAIIAIGGGGVQPMRQRWERTLQRYDEEKPRLQAQMRQRRTGEGRVSASGAEPLRGDQPPGSRRA